MDSRIYPLRPLMDLNHFELFSLEFESECLKFNLLGDNTYRRNIVAVPRNVSEPSGGWPVLLHLSGLGGNGTTVLNLKFNDPNVLQALDEARTKKAAPAALYVFVDALTSLGGSQFVNSPVTGAFEDYIVTEMAQALKFHWNCKEQWGVTGGSSGGYGALHLVSQYPEHFPWGSAHAPDSFFLASLLPDLFAALPELTRFETVQKAIEAFLKGEWRGHRSEFKVLNALSMVACYAPQQLQSLANLTFPLDLNSGQLDQKAWQEICERDPVNFLPKRSENLKKIKGFYLDVGLYDQYHLQWGSRQIRDLLGRNGVPLIYNEFKGNHFDLGTRRPFAWSWFQSQWS